MLQLLRRSIRLEAIGTPRISGNRHTSGQEYRISIPNFAPAVKRSGKRVRPKNLSSYGRDIIAMNVKTFYKILV